MGSSWSSPVHIHTSFQAWLLCGAFDQTILFIRITAFAGPWISFVCAVIALLIGWFQLFADYLLLYTTRFSTVLLLILHSFASAFARDASFVFVANWLFRAKENSPAFMRGVLLYTTLCFYFYSSCWVFSARGFYRQRCFWYRNKVWIVLLITFPP